LNTSLWLMTKFKLVPHNFSFQIGHQNLPCQLQGDLQPVEVLAKNSGEDAYTKVRADLNIFTKDFSLTDEN
jgi:hypothetical protein